MSCQPNGKPSAYYDRYCYNYAYYIFLPYELTQNLVFIVNADCDLVNMGM